jgi:hypothetical protein
MELESSDPKRGSKFIYCPHMDEEKIYLERRHRFIRIPVNQKYSRLVKEISISVKQQTIFHRFEKHFTESLVVWSQIPHLLHHKHKTFNEDEETLR